MRIVSEASIGRTRAAEKALCFQSFGEDLGEDVSSVEDSKEPAGDMGKKNGGRLKLPAKDLQA